MFPNIIISQFIRTFTIKTRTDKVIEISNLFGLIPNKKFMPPLNIIDWHIMEFHVILSNLILT